MTDTECNRAFQQLAATSGRRHVEQRHCVKARSMFKGIRSLWGHVMVGFIIWRKTDEGMEVRDIAMWQGVHESNIVALK